MRNEIVFFLLGTILSMFGFLSILDPERAFRIQNLFQLREVELSQFGEDTAVAGGVMSIVLGWLMVGGLLSLEYAVLSVVVAGAPMLWLYRDEVRI